MLALLLLLQSGVPDPPTYDGWKKQLAVTLPRIEADPRVDGMLYEPLWRRAARLVGFSQYRPVDGRPAEDSTEVLVWYAPDAIWFGVRAYEPHGNVVRATLADRDHIDADDNIQILLDTYNDHRRALLFAVNPLGVQEDGVRSEGQDAGAAGGGASATGRYDGIVDLSPDFVYQSHGHRTDWGYEVEVRIPFKSLRYQSADPQSWGLQVVRVVQHSGYEDTWTPVFRASASFLIQSGRLTGLTGLKRGVVVDLTPEFTSKVDGAPASTGYDYRGTPELGGNVRWGLTQNLGLTATAHPDFSQVEADVGQVTVNERFALFYPEKRPFFLDGLEQFDTPNRLIYTRQIVQPVAGAKLTGKLGSTAVAYLGAVDDRGQSASGNNPVFNLLRLRRDLGTASTAGLVYTDRIEGDDYNRVLPAAGHLRGRAPEHVDRDVARRLERERLDQEQRATLRPRRLRGLQREPHGGHDPVRGAARAVQPVEHERRCGDAESGLHFQHELRLRRDGHLRGSGSGASVLHPGDRWLEANAGRADRGALDPRATHPGTGRQSLLDGEHPAPEARVPAVARHLLPVRRPVLRAGPGRAPGSAHRAADPGGRGSGGGRGDQRLPQRPAVLLQAAARDAGLPGLWHVAHGARGVSIPEPEPRVGRVLPEGELPVPDVAHYPPARAPLILSACPRPPPWKRSWRKRPAPNSATTSSRTPERAGPPWASGWRCWRAYASGVSCPSRGGSSSGSQPHSRLRTTRCTGSPATSRSDPGTSTSTSRSAPR